MSFHLSNHPSIVHFKSEIVVVIVLGLGLGLSSCVYCTS